MDITKLSLTELESLAFRQLEQIEMYQKNLMALNAQIRIKRDDQKPDPVIVPEVKPE